MESSKGRLIGYWIFTALICLSQGASGIMDLIGAEPVASGIAALGYPSYVLYILGFWKLAAVPALLVPGLPLLKEWAYAGFFFDFVGGMRSVGSSENMRNTSSLSSASPGTIAA